MKIVYITELNCTVLNIYFVFVVILFLMTKANYARYLCIYRIHTMINDTFTHTHTHTYNVYTHSNFSHVICTAYCLS